MDSKGASLFDLALSFSMLCFSHSESRGIQLCVSCVYGELIRSVGNAYSEFTLPVSIITSQWHRWLTDRTCIDCVYVCMQLWWASTVARGHPRHVKGKKSRLEVQASARPCPPLPVTSFLPFLSLHQCSLESDPSLTTVYCLNHSPLTNWPV